MHAGTQPAASGREFARVVAVLPANDNHHIGLPRHLQRRRLPLLGRLANGVQEADSERGKQAARRSHQMADPVDRLRGLGRDTKPGALRQLQRVLLRQDHVEFRRSCVDPRTSTCPRWPMMTG